MPHRPKTVVASVPPWHGYCVPDPDYGSRLTYWWVDAASVLHRWPPGVRWEPNPPEFGGPDRTADRDDWYREIYFVWKWAVAEAIEADPDRAAARFAERYPNVELPQPGASLRRAETERETERRRYEEVTAAAYARQGVSVRQVAQRLGVAWATARARIAAGERLLAEDPEKAQQAIVRHLRRVLDDDSAERLAARLLAGSGTSAAPG